jgi:hypothetical protein
MGLTVDFSDKRQVTYLVCVQESGPTIVDSIYCTTWISRVEVLTTQSLWCIIRQTHISTWLCDEPRQRWVVIKPHGSQSLRCGQASQTNGGGTAPCHRIAIRVIFALEHHCAFLQRSILRSIFRTVPGFGAAQPQTGLDGMVATYC